MFPTWDVRGNCAIDSDGCFTDGPGYYGADEDCEVCVLRSGTVTAITFDTESSYDRLTVGSGGSFSGTTGPTNVAVSAGDCITFTSDSSVQKSGFQLCADGATTPGPGQGTGLLPVINTDGDGCGYSGCLACEGDCDSNSDCAGDLQCYQRTSPDSTVPSCQTTGYYRTTSDWDYCYDPNWETAASSSDDDDGSGATWLLYLCIPGILFAGCFVVINRSMQSQQKAARAAQNRPAAYQNPGFAAPKPVVAPWVSPVAPKPVASFSPYPVVSSARMSTTQAATTIQANYRGHATRQSMQSNRRSSAFAPRKPVAMSKVATKAANRDDPFDVPDYGDPFADLGDPFDNAMTDMKSHKGGSKSGAGRNGLHYTTSNLIPRSSDAVVPTYRPPPKPWLCAPY